MLAGISFSVPLITNFRCGNFISLALPQVATVPGPTSLPGALRVCTRLPGGVIGLSKLRLYSAIFPGIVALQDARSSATSNLIGRNLSRDSLQQILRSCHETPSLPSEYHLEGLTSLSSSAAHQYKTQCWPLFRLPKCCPLKYDNASVQPIKRRLAVLAFSNMVSKHAFTLPFVGGCAKMHGHGWCSCRRRTSRQKLQLGMFEATFLLPGHGILSWGQVRRILL